MNRLISKEQLDCIKHMTVSKIDTLSICCIKKMFNLNLLNIQTENKICFCRICFYMILKADSGSYTQASGEIS